MINTRFDALRAYVHSVLPAGWKLVDDISFSGEERAASLKILNGSLDNTAIEADLVVEFRALFEEDVYSAVNQVMFALEPAGDDIYEEDAADGDGEGEGEGESNGRYVKLLKTGSRAKIFFNSRQLREVGGE